MRAADARSGAEVTLIRNINTSVVGIALPHNTRVHKKGTDILQEHLLEEGVITGEEQIVDTGPRSRKGRETVVCGVQLIGTPMEQDAQYDCLSQHKPGIFSALTRGEVVTPDETPSPRKARFDRAPVFRRPQGYTYRAHA